MENFIVLDEPMELPPGFRFHPTDEELITHYLTPKFVDPRFTSKAVGEVDLNKDEPWDLPRKAKMEGKEWYFFCVRDRKYPTGSRANRATGAGYWKATGKDREIFRGAGVLVGMKKTLVFYMGRAPTGTRTDWVMHEYRLEGKQARPAKVEWVLCRVFKKRSSGLKLLASGLESASNSTSLSEWFAPYSSNQSGRVLMQDDDLEEPSCNKLGVKPYYNCADHHHHLQDLPLSDHVMDLDCLWNY